MIESIRKGDFSAGFAIFNRTIPFPGIISRVCDHPCQDVCKRIEVGEAIQINALERACMEYCRGPQKKRLFITKKDKKAAIVGAGLSGLTAAFDLASKGYSIEVFEAGNILGGRLREFDSRQLPQQIIDDDLAALEERDVVIHRNVRVANGNGGSPSFDEIVGAFDAVYIGPGPHTVDHLNLTIALTPSGLIQTEPVTYGTSNPKVFSGGGHRYHPGDYSPITSLLDGRLAAVSIDRLLQGASLSARRELEGPFVTKLYTDTFGIEPLPAVPMSVKEQGYSPEEAGAEARRCLHCQCLECVKVCEYLAHYGAYPKRYVREIYNNDSIIMGAHTANRMVNSCSLCGLCKEVCPVDLNMADVCLEARQSMVKKGKMPPSVHDFALRDMQFSLSEAFYLARHEPGFSASSALFYPGCQLSASSPHHVKSIYAYLRSLIKGGVGLILGCCGAPAAWAGQEELFLGAIHSLADEWQRMGKPRIITACSSCYRLFKDNLADLTVESLWTVLDHADLPLNQPAAGSRELAIHDPCTTRHDQHIQKSVRRIAVKLGVELKELGHHPELTTCCGYGGHMFFANPEVADKVVNRRIRESDADYLAYCAMCRDHFAAKGKRVLHVLDLIFGVGNGDPASLRGPGYSKRHENRAKLKKEFLRDLWGEKGAEEGPGMKLIITPIVSELLERRMILEEDLLEVIRHVERTGDKFKDPKTGHFIARFRPVSVTYWVEYSSSDSGFIIHNAYSHRMEVVGGGP
jgi:Fe-S oxidoreductase